jgi:hypothetical protein
MKKSLLFFFILLVSLCPLFSIEDYRTRVAVLPMENRTGIEEYDSLCITMMEILTLVLEFQKDYRVVYPEEYQYYLASEDIDTEGLNSFTTENKVDNVIYGNVVATELGSFIFTLSQFDRSLGKVTIDITETAESLFDVFDTADLLTREITGFFGEIHLGFGSIAVNKIRGLGQYTVYLDGYPVRNQEKTFAKVLNGSYDIAIHQNRLLGDTIIFETSIEVFEDQQSDILFSIPGATQDELNYFDELKRSMLEAGSNTENIEKFLSSMIEFQEKTQSIDYDPALINAKKNQMDAAGSLAAAMLEELISDADKGFYEKDAQFENVLEKYNYISSLIASDFTYEFIDDVGVENQVLVNPKELIRTDNGFLYVVTHHDKTAISEYRKTLSSEELSEADNLFKDQTILYVYNQNGELQKSSLFGSQFRWCSDTLSHLYVHVPGTEFIVVLNPGLRNPRILPIPDPPVSAPERVDLTVSDEGIVYLFLDEEIRIFESNFDPKESDYPDRYFTREKAVSEIFSQLEWEPASWKFDHYGDLHLIDKLNRQILKIDMLGESLADISLERGEEDSSIWIDKLGYYYLSDPLNHEILKYNPLGQMISIIGEYGTAPGEFSIPYGVAVDDSGSIYVADSYNSRIQIFHLASPPILVPTVSRYNSLINRRLDRSELAVKKITGLDEKEIKFGKDFGKILTGTLLTAGAVGALAGYDAASFLTMENYTVYQSAITETDVIDARTQTDLYANLGRTCLYGSIPLLTFGVSYLFDGILNTARDIHLKPLAYRNIQNQKMDTIYTLNEKKYKSLQNVQSLGVWTGVVPGVLSLGITVTQLTLHFLEIDIGNLSDSLLYANMGLVGIPPIWSHLAGGRFSTSLFLTGLVADVLMSGVYFYYKDTLFDFALEDTIYTGDMFDINRTVETFKPLGGVYLLLAANAIRLTAGIFDTKYGWTLAMERNSYKAQTGTEPEGEEKLDSNVSFDASPFITPNGEFGFAFRISMR